MSRGRLGLLLFGVIVLIVLAVGLTRPTNERTDDGSNDASDAPPTSAPIVGVGGDLSGEEPILQPANEVVRGGSGGDCRGLVQDDPSPSCQGFDVNGVSVAWVVEQDGSTPPVASLLRLQEGDWTRVLEADGAGDRGFDLVNVRIDDITGDGVVEVFYGFHNGDELGVDIVDAGGTVLSHLDVGEGQVLIGGGEVVLWRRDGDAWVREVIRTVDGTLDIVETERVDGPAGGNL